MQQLLKKYFGLSSAVVKCEAPKGLPIYMTVDRDFYIVQIADVKFLMIELSQVDKFGAIALKKQLAKYEESCGLNAAYMINVLTKRQRDSLVEHQISFITIPNQIYLPFLAIVLNSRFKNNNVLELEHFTPASQSLFLLFLYNSDMKSLLKKDAAAMLGITQMSITRASGQLASIGLIKEERKGKEIRMLPVSSGRDFYYMGKNYLINPIVKSLFVKTNEALSSLPLSGESALAKRTMLNPARITTVAMRNGSIDILKQDIADSRWDDNDSIINVEMWRYDPMVFAKDGLVDPISMALSLNSNNDERIQGELEKYMEELEW